MAWSDEARRAAAEARRRKSGHTNKKIKAESKRLAAAHAAAIRQPTLSTPKHRGTHHFANAILAHMQSLSIHKKGKHK